MTTPFSPPDSCPCVTALHCEKAGRCLAECVPEDLERAETAEDTLTALRAWLLTVHGDGAVDRLPFQDVIDWLDARGHTKFGTGPVCGESPEAEFARKLVNSQGDLPEEAAKVLRENHWALLDDGKPTSQAATGPDAPLDLLTMTQEQWGGIEFYERPSAATDTVGDVFARELMAEVRAQYAARQAQAETIRQSEDAVELYRASAKAAYQRVMQAEAERDAARAEVAQRRQENEEWITLATNLKLDLAALRTQHAALVEWLEAFQAKWRVKHEYAAMVDVDEVLARLRDGGKE